MPVKLNEYLDKLVLEEDQNIQDNIQSLIEQHKITYQTKDIAKYGVYDALARFNKLIDSSIATIYSDYIFLFTSIKGSLSQPYYYANTKMVFDYE